MFSMIVGKFARKILMPIRFEIGEKTIIDQSRLSRMMKGKYKSVFEKNDIEIHLFAHLTPELCMPLFHTVHLLEVGCHNINGVREID